MKKIREVLRLRQLGSANVREMARACGISTSTVHEYLKRAQGAGLSWPLPEGLTDSDLEALLFAAANGKEKKPVPDWAAVQRELSRKGVTLDLLWQEYRKNHPKGYGRSQFSLHYRQWEKSSDLRMLQHHVAGERMWVDWAGLTGEWVDPGTGEVSKVQIFVAAFGVSQKLFCKAFPTQEMENWLEAQACALDFYGVAPQIAVPDNTKSGVTEAHRYEPSLNLEYVEFARHYGIAVIPTRVRKPRDKAKVENAVQQIERWVLAPLRDQKFMSLQDLNEELLVLTNALNDRLMKGPDASRNQIFEELDRPAASPLPELRYRYAHWKKAKIAPDYHVEFEGHKYSVPYIHVSKTVEMRIGSDTVQIFLGGKTIATHPRHLSRRGFTTDDSHMPKCHKEHAEWTPVRLTRWASESGESVGLFVEAMLETKVHPQQGFRPALGLIGLAKKYGDERLNAACARALGYRALTYKSVRSILEKGLDSTPTVAPEPQASLPIHENVRGAIYFKGEQTCAN